MRDLIGKDIKERASLLAIIPGGRVPTTVISISFSPLRSFLSLFQIFIFFHKIFIHSIPRISYYSRKILRCTDHSLEDRQITTFVPKRHRRPRQSPPDSLHYRLQYSTFYLTIFKNTKFSDPLHLCLQSFIHFYITHTDDASSNSIVLIFNIKFHIFLKMLSNYKSFKLFIYYKL